MGKAATGISSTGRRDKIALFLSNCDVDELSKTWGLEGFFTKVRRGVDEGKKAIFSCGRMASAPVSRSMERRHFFIRESELFSFLYRGTNINLKLLLSSTGDDDHLRSKSVHRKGSPEPLTTLQKV